MAPRSKHISKSNWNCLHSCTIDYVTSPKHQFSLKRARGRLRILPPLPIKIIKLCCGHCCKWIYLKKRNKCEIKYSWWRVWRCILLFNFYTFQIKVRVTFTVGGVCGEELTLGFGSDSNIQYITNTGCILEKKNRHCVLSLFCVTLTRYGVKGGGARFVLG